jgi:hypothetical protein
MSAFECKADMVIAEAIDRQLSVMVAGPIAFAFATAIDQQSMHALRAYRRDGDYLALRIKEGSHAMCTGEIANRYVHNKRKAAQRNRTAFPGKGQPQFVALSVIDQSRYLNSSA